MSKTLMKRFLIIAVSLLTVVYLLTGLTQVRPEEMAVVRRFGEPVARWGPGLHFGLPWGMDRIDRVAVTSVRQLKVGFTPGTDYTSGPTPAGQFLTADQNLVNLQIAIDYTVDTAGDGLEQFVMARDWVNDVLVRAAESATGEWVAAHAVDEVLLTGNAELPLSLMRRLPERLESYSLGVSIRQVNVSYLAPPDEVKDMFEEVNRAQSNMLTLENQAEQEANRRLSTAAVEKDRQEQAAAAYREERTRIAQAEADAFVNRLEQYRRLREANPDVLAAIWWDEMGKLFVGMKQRGRIDLLDNHLGPDGLDVTQVVPPGK